MDEIRIQGADAQALGGQVMPPEDVITREQLQEFSRVLHEYKVGKASTDAVVCSSVLILFSDVFLTQILS